jgi:hypothetical protein
MNQRAILDARFGVLTRMDGAEVIDNTTGRPLAYFDARPMADLEAFTLNAAAAEGPRALARALGAVEDDAA